MSDAMKALLNLRSLRAVAKEMTAEQLKEALEKLQTVVEEREEIERQAQEEEKARLAKLEKYREMLIADGIEPDELMKLLGGASKSKSTGKRAARPAKYQYTDSDGSVKTWTGQGRMPKVIREATENGSAKLEDFLIPGQQA
ncbi:MULTISPECIES: H-NS family nucleoid-associated regulatory protein [Salinivibrio]|jgi:DNA-binding protein H-NS|uniref:DNA-binding protein n=2 Tax=Salinivibrio TaxID=51366 RepID=A0ABY7LHL8_9GAMM|nr:MULTISPECIES: H-NS family nucleoid-associated regulatory protein [Salinivibrio]ODP99971.1 transcriptional regulator [Salinivibrio sp. DV]OOF09909.1 transcriptional regulator [Salinivibrio sp. PR5]OOF20836.1 transcriptional regulator [Salinivibrio sp. IB574]OOF29042.1 transcriptional regulator [Salinivibrio sp. IB872]PCE66880.1 transcriptional regulator [Salinivibrio sp. YCSC6]